MSLRPGIVGQRDRHGRRCIVHRGTANEYDGRRTAVTRQVDRRHGKWVEASSEGDTLEHELPIVAGCRALAGRFQFDGDTRFRLADKVDHREFSDPIAQRQRVKVRIQIKRRRIGRDRVDLDHQLR